MSLTIQARADMPKSNFAWVPALADYDEILIGKGGKFSIDLKNVDSTKVKLEVVSEPDPNIVKKYKIKKDKLKPEQTTQIKIELKKDLPPGNFKTALTVQRENDPQSRFTIPITGKVVEKLSPPGKHVKASSKKAPAKGKKQALKPKANAKQKTEIQTRKTQAKKRVKAKPAKKPLPLSTIDDSDFR